MVSDLLKVLESLPLWKQLAELPRRVAALEARLATLESGRKPDQPLCPGCQMPLTFKGERAEPGPFGDLGARERVWECPACKAEIIKPVKN